MTADEIIDRFIVHLDFHMNSTANVHQSHYKGDFFKLFREVPATHRRRTARPVERALAARKRPQGPKN
jgi:hypothetical protein